MERELAQNAVQMKMKSKWESPLISIYEFCYASGLELKAMHLPEDKFENLKEMESFDEFHKEILSIVSKSEDWKTISDGEKLHHLILSYRIQEELNEDARILFEKGFKG